jgi:hypothetical protein
VAGDEIDVHPAAGRVRLWLIPCVVIVLKNAVIGSDQGIVAARLIQLTDMINKYCNK